MPPCNWIASWEMWRPDRLIIEAGHVESGGAQVGQQLPIDSVVLGETDGLYDAEGLLDQPGRGRVQRPDDVLGRAAEIGGLDDMAVIVATGIFDREQDRPRE